MHITKTMRVSGSSDRSIEAAIKTVLARVAESIREIISYEVVTISGSVDESGAPKDFHVDLDITFIVGEVAHN